MIDDDILFKKYNNKDNNYFHEAGYDAYITGCAFIGISYMIMNSISDIDPKELLKNPIDLVQTH